MVSILHLLAPDLPTGTAKQIGYLTKGLMASGDTVRICSFENNQVRKLRLERHLSGVEYCQQSLKLDPTVVVRGARKIREVAPDVVHLWGSHQKIYTQLALRLAGHTKVLWSMRSAAERFSLPPKNSKYTIVTNANHLTESLEQQFDRVETVPNALVKCTTPHVVSSLHRELELSPDSIFITAMGDLRRKKRWQDVTWAFDLLRVIHPNVHLLIMGEGDLENELRAFVQPASSADAVHFLGFRDDVSQVLQQSICFWQMSEDEGCSNSLLEAISVGLPIVASDTPGHRKLLHDSKYGSLVEVGDCAEMARKTNVLMGQDGFVSNGEVVFDRFALRKMVTHYQAIYREVLKSHPVAA